MSNSHDPHASDPSGVPSVPPAAHYAPPVPPSVAPARPQYAAPPAPGTPVRQPMTQTYQSGYVAPTNGMAIAALITGLLVPLVGIILGHVSLSQIKRTGESGRGMALTGLILGYTFTILTILSCVFLIAIISMDSMSSGVNY